jgi:hypothetical protein
MIGDDSVVVGTLQEEKELRMWEDDGKVELVDEAIKLADM